MQMFILDEDIEQNVKYYTDRHVVKLITEICQMLSTLHQLRNKYKLPDFLYKVTHPHHPCLKWMNESKANYKYSCKLGLALYNEYQYRYNKPEKFCKAKLILDWCIKYIPNFEIKDLTPFAQAMPEQYKKDNAIEAYREYYRKEKSHLFKWTKRDKPNWI